MLVPRRTGRTQVKFIFLQARTPARSSRIHEVSGAMSVKYILPQPIVHLRELLSIEKEGHCFRKIRSNVKKEVYDKVLSASKYNNT